MEEKLLEAIRGIDNAMLIIDNPSLLGSNPKDQLMQSKKLLWESIIELRNIKGIL